MQVDRLMELHFKYLEKVRLADAKIEKERNASITPRCTTVFFSKAANLQQILVFTICYLPLASCASEAFEKRGDLNREVSHIKCQWYKNVRAEAAVILKAFGRISSQKILNFNTD